jgi:hypothetical protein
MGARMHVTTFYSEIWNISPYRNLGSPCDDWSTETWRSETYYEKSLLKVNNLGHTTKYTNSNVARKNTARAAMINHLAPGCLWHSVIHSPVCCFLERTRSTQSEFHWIHHKDRNLGTRRSWYSLIHHKDRVTSINHGNIHYSKKLETRDSCSHAHFRSCMQIRTPEPIRPSARSASASPERGE